MRILKASIVCGALATGLAGLLFKAGVFAPLQQALFAGGLGPAWAQWVGAAVLGFGLAGSTVDINQTPLKLIVAAAALLETAALSWVLHRFGIAWPPFTALAAGLLATGLGLAWGRTPGGARKRHLETLFGGRISRRKFREWLDSDEPLEGSGERTEGSVIVCEIFNQELLADTLSPRDCIALTNAFLSTGAKALMESGGVLDVAGGDRLRAVFGIPIAEPNHAAQACAAALELGHTLEAFCQEAQERWKIAPDFRIAVNSGEMVAATGYVGSFSVTGESLEFCRRLCAANAFYGSRILLGPHAFQLAPEAVEVRPIELFVPHGQQAPEEIYELLAPKNRLTAEEAERRDTFWKGIVLFREREWDLAAAHFETVLRCDAMCEDGPSRFYLNRIAHLRDGVRALDWDTVKL